MHVKSTPARSVMAPGWKRALTSQNAMATHTRPTTIAWNCGQSAAWPGVRTKTSGRPEASTAAWTLLLSPPLDRPSPAAFARSRPDAQIVAVVVAIRAARGGVGNLTGQDLSALRLGHPRGAVDALRGLGWQMDNALFDGDPSTPVPVTVPALTQKSDHPLPFGKSTRSRVSG
ncbi:hypothetical protein ACFT9I_01540 [Streptomyces sp. NPDC057137]|uniref:hypothetical protein n=1 Tax=Streptomyces sp. NPDC057137 TaxID=3346030 RepID=UPI003635C671